MLDEAIITKDLDEADNKLLVRIIIKGTKKILK